MRARAARGGRKKFGGAERGSWLGGCVAVGSDRSRGCERGGLPAKLSPARAEAIRQSRWRQHARALGLALSPADERRREALRQRARSLFRASDEKMIMRAHRRLASGKRAKRRP
jgi:hypothetical protein